jgi:hypothetical protein
MLDVLRHFEQPIDRGRGQHCGTRVAGECEFLWNEFDPLTGGRPTLTRWGDRRMTT